MATSLMPNMNVDAAAEAEAIAALQTAPDPDAPEPTITATAAPAQTQIEQKVSTEAAAATAAAETSVVSPPASPAVETPAASSALTEVEKIARDRLAAYRRRTQPRRAAPVPEHPEATPEPAVSSTNPLEFDIIAEAQRRGVDPRELALAALNRVKDPNATKAWTPPLAVTKIQELEARNAALEEKLNKTIDDLHLAGSEWAEQQQTQQIANSEAQLLLAGANAIQEPETRAAYPRVAKQKAEWVGKAVLGAYRGHAALNDRRVAKGLPILYLTPQAIFAGIEAELKELGVEPISLSVSAGTPKVESATAKVESAAAKAGPQLTEDASRKQTTQGFSFAIPPGMEMVRLAPGETYEDLMAFQKASDSLEVSKD